MTLRITVEPCIDSEEWVWSLIAEDGGVYMDGYSDSEFDAWNDAKAERREVYETWRQEPGHA